MPIPIRDQCIEDEIADEHVERLELRRSGETGWPGIAIQDGLNVLEGMTGRFQRIMVAEQRPQQHVAIVQSPVSGSHVIRETTATTVTDSKLDLGSRNVQPARNL